MSEEKPRYGTDMGPPTECPKCHGQMFQTERRTWGHCGGCQRKAHRKANAWITKRIARNEREKGGAIESNG